MKPLHARELGWIGEDIYQQLNPGRGGRRIPFSFPCRMP